MPSTDHQVIQHSDVEEAQCLLQALGDLAVSFAWLRIAAWVVVEKDDGSGVQLQGALGDYSRMNIAPVDGATEEMFGCQDLVLDVQEDDPEDFVTQMCAAGNQVITGLVGAVDAALALKALLQDIRCREENPLLVHLELVLSLQVLGALHRFFSTSALCASWEPTGEALGSTAPGSEHRWRRAAEGRTTWRRPALAVGTAKLGFPSRGPALVKTAPYMPYKPWGLSDIRMDGVHGCQQAMAGLCSQ